MTCRGMSRSERWVYRQGLIDPPVECRRARVGEWHVLSDSPEHSGTPGGFDDRGL
jgi:hypothetical protein